MKDENLLTIKQAAAVAIPGQRLNVGTLYRWAYSGLCSGRVRLETVKRGFRTYTTREAMDRFFRRCDALRDQVDVSHGNAVSELKEAGFDN